MKKKEDVRTSVSVQNVTQKQYSWLRKRAEDSGVAMSGIVKMLIQKEIERTEQLKS